MTTTSQALEAIKNRPDKMVEGARSDFALVLPPQIDVDQWVRTVQGVVRRSPSLATAAKKNPGSFMAAMLRCAHLGLEPGDTFHLVPFGNEITGITDYKGHLELIARAGATKSVKALIVYEADSFVYNPAEMDRPSHEPPGWFSDRGAMVGAYAYAEMKDGGTSNVVIMDKAKIMRHRAKSKNQKLWDEWPESAWLKTVVKELSKWVPTSPIDRSFQAVSQSQPLPTPDGEAIADQSGDEFPHDDITVDADVLDGDA